MNNLTDRITRNIFNLNFYKRLPMVLGQIINRIYHERVLFKIASKDSVFTSIWKNNYWSDNESLSGPGSSLAYTENIRKRLPVLFTEFSIKDVFDAPCGDFTWMKEVVKNTQIRYTGGDIVKGIIKSNHIYQNEKVNFIVFDITEQQPPQSDLWICRDVFFHLSNKDILSSLKQFVKSEVPYLLTTTHKNTSHFSNSDIVSGDFRLIDLFEHPYHFPKNVLYRFEDYIDPHPPREMCLFTSEQIAQIIPDFSEAIKNN